MRRAIVLFKDQDAGMLTQLDDGSFTFMYNDSWLIDDSKPGISLTLPKRSKLYTSAYLFPFFFNMLPEGINKQTICKSGKIDGDDYFGLLLEIAKHDTIGAVRVIQQ